MNTYCDPPSLGTLIFPGKELPGESPVPRLFIFTKTCKCEGTKSLTVVGSKVNPEFGRGGDGKNKNIFEHSLRKQDKSNFGYIKALLLWKGICQSSFGLAIEKNTRRKASQNSKHWESLLGARLWAGMA